IRRIGKPEVVIEDYFSSRPAVHQGSFQGPLADDIDISAIRIKGEEATGAVTARPTEAIEITLEGFAKRTFEDVQFALTLSTKGVRLVTVHDSDDFRPLAEGGFAVSITIPA